MQWEQWEEDETLNDGSVVDVKVHNPADGAPETQKTILTRRQVCVHQITSNESLKDR